MDLGFAQAGFELAWANERNPSACETYELNLGTHLVRGDLDDVTLPTDSFDVVCGGPPCQGWSRIGRMDPEDPRSQHVHRFLDVVEAVEPRAFVMENVAHLGEAPRWKSVRDELVRRASEDLGFNTRILILDASEFGVPQARHRMFLVGIRDAHMPNPRRTTVKQRKTVGETLRKLPDFGEPGNDTVCTARVIAATRPVLRTSAYTGALLFNGSGRPLDLAAPARTLPASMGGNATPIVDQLELEDERAPWVVEYLDHLVRGGIPRKRVPSRLRRLTVQEAAALQSFPPDFQFRGSVYAQYKQIGNAVPPALARAVARGLVQALRDGSPACERRVAS